MAGTSKNARMIDDGFSVMADFFKLIIFFAQILFKMWALACIPHYAGAEWLVEYFPGEGQIPLWDLRTLYNPIFIFCFLWSIVHYEIEEFGKEFFLASSCLSLMGLAYFDNFSFTNLKWFSELTWYGAIFGIFVVIGIIYYVIGSLISLKAFIMGSGRLSLWLFVELPMRGIDYVSPSLYEYIVKKVSLRLDVNFRFTEKPYYHTEGEVDPRDGKTFYQSSEWRKLRYKAFEKYGTICLDPHCNNQATHVDHVKPRSLRPDLALDINNLQVLCEDCNRMKSNKSDVDFRNIKKKQ